MITQERQRQTILRTQPRFLLVCGEALELRSGQAAQIEALGQSRRVHAKTVPQGIEARLDPDVRIDDRADLEGDALSVQLPDVLGDARQEGDEEPSLFASDRDPPQELRSPGAPATARIPVQSARGLLPEVARLLVAALAQECLGEPRGVIEDVAGVLLEEMGLFFAQAGRVTNQGVERGSRQTVGHARTIQVTVEELVLEVFFELRRGVDARRTLRELSGESLGARLDEALQLAIDRRPLVGEPLALETELDAHGSDHLVQLARRNAVSGVAGSCQQFRERPILELVEGTAPFLPFLGFTHGEQRAIDMIRQGHLELADDRVGGCAELAHHGPAPGSDVDAGGF